MHISSTTSIPPFPVTTQQQTFPTLVSCENIRFHVMSRHTTLTSTDVKYVAYPTPHSLVTHLPLPVPRVFQQNKPVNRVLCDGPSELTKLSVGDKISYILTKSRLQVVPVQVHWWCHCRVLKLETEESFGTPTLVPILFANKPNENFNSQ